MKPTVPANSEPDESGFIPFCDMISGHAAVNPGGIAFRVGEQLLDWQTLQERVSQVARALVARYVKPGDRVAVLGFPSLTYA